MHGVYLISLLVGTYQNSGSSEFQVSPGSRPDNASVVIGPQGPGFPVQWEPRYKLAVSKYFMERKLLE